MRSPRPRRLLLSNYLKPGDQFHYAETSLGADGNEPHYHDFVEFFWVVRGSGEEVAGQVSWPLDVGDVVFVPAEQEHRHRATDSALLTIRNVAFPQSVWRRLRSAYGETLFDPFAAPPEGRRWRVPHLLGVLEDAARDLKRGRRDRITLDRFLLQLDAALTSSRATARPGPDWLAEAVRALADDERVDLSAGPAAFVEACGRSGEHVARACRRYLDRTPTQLVDEARCRRAARLLSETTRPVLDVCFASGFNNVGHFHERFRRRFGETPRQYRLRTQGPVTAG